MSEATGDASSTLRFNSVEMRKAEQEFRQAYPAFASTSFLDELRASGAPFTSLPVMATELRVEEGFLLSFLEQGKNHTHPLLAYPAQSNFTGVQHPLEWIEEAQMRGWDVILDGAAFVPTNRLDLS